MKLSKLLSLYINEMIKISRKISAIILISIMIIGVIGFGGLMKLNETMNNNQMKNISQVDFAKQSMDAQLDDMKTRLKEIEIQLEGASEENVLYLEQEKASLVSQIELFELAISKNININSEDYRADILNTIIELKAQQIQLNSTPFEFQTEQEKKKVALNDALLKRYEKIIENNDFKDFIAISNEQINDNDSISDNEKKILLESNQLLLKYNLTGQQKNDIQYENSSYLLISQIENYKRSLVANVDLVSRKPLTNELKEKTKNDLAVALYKLDKDVGTSQSGFSINEIAVEGMFGFGIFIIILIMLILAGGSVSGEMSTGSIKSLIISPTKRWKIFTAKVFSLLTVGVFSALILYAVVIITNGILFGQGLSYIFATNGVAHELNFYIYRFAYVFVNFIDVIVYMALAFMLSVITRNTAASVGISIAVFFGGNIANSFIQLFAKGEWVKFIPFNNLSLASKIFENNSFSQAMNSGMYGTNYAVNIPISFSLCYLLVIIICMGYTALDSFNRRDIK